MNIVVKPQWKAAIDFKWIRDNKESVAVNIKNRNSNANVEIVLQLYDKLLNVQKVNFLSHLFTLLPIMLSLPITKSMIQLC